MSLWEPIKFDQDTIEQAVALCAGLGDADVSAFCKAVYPLAYDDVEARTDLARVAFFECYRRRTPCWIYFAQIGEGDMVKVGRSIIVDARLNSLSRKHAVEHRLIGSVRGDYREERQLHAYFRRHRITNLIGRQREYYRLEPLRPIIDQMLIAGEFIDLPLRPLA